MLINRSEENWLTILGLPRLSQQGRREWQDAARKQVNDLIRLTLKLHKVHLDYKVIVVHNPLRFRTSGMAVLNVQMCSVEASSRIRELYSGFFRRNRPVALPPHLKGVSIRNKVTKETRVRIAILQQLGANYLAHNPGSSIDVRGYGPRPLLSTFPPTPSSGGQTGSSRSAAQPKTFNFIEAVTTLPSGLSDDNLSRIFSVVGASYPGKLKDLFVILSDDDRDRCQGLVKRRFAPPAVAAAASGSSGPSFARAMSGQVATSGGGMDLESGFLAALARPPPPPPPLPISSPSRSRSSSPARRRLRSTPASRSPSPAKKGLKRRRLSSDSSTDHKRSRRAPSSSSDSSSDSDSSSASSTPSRGTRRRKSGHKKRSTRDKARKGTNRSKKQNSGKSSGKSSAKSREK